MSDLLPVKPSSMPAAEASYQPYGQPEDYGGGTVSSLRVRRILTFLAKYWWIPMLTLLVGVSAAGAYVWFLMPPTFVSSGRIWEAEKLRLTEGAAFTEDFENYYGTQLALLQSARVRQLAFESMQAASTNSIARDADGKPLQVRVGVYQQPKSTVFNVTASSSDPTYSQAFLNALMTAFQAYRKSIREAAAGTTYSSISDQVKRLEGELKADQDALAEFQKTNNLAILQEEGTVSGGYLARLKTQLSEQQLEAQLLKATMLEQESANASGTNAAPFLIESLRGGLAASSDSVSGARRNAFQELELLKARREKFSKVFKPKHPKMVRLDAEIERGQQLIELYRRQTGEQLAAAQQAVQMRISSIEASIKEWETKVVESKVKIAEAERLRQNVARSQGLYDRLMRLLENVDLTRNINEESLTILEPASPATRSYKDEVITVALGAFLGLALGVGLVLLIELRDDRFTSLVEVTDKFGDSIVGQVPEVRELRSRKASALLEPASEPHLLSESYRSLRSALLYLPLETERPKIVLVTSALPGEGKSTIAANLARTVALGGARVLLVDGDLRKGALHKPLGLKSEPGLAELLLDPQAMDRVAQANGVNNLTFISRGKIPAHPGDLFIGHALDELLARWRQEYDFVVIDSCPVFAADDVTTLAPKADGTLFVVRRRHAGAKMVREALELLAHRQARILGLVFNRADSSSPSYYYYKYSEYYSKGHRNNGTGEVRS
jgi:succinoglycan biosynthesis transport protein ExoP